MPKRLAKKVLLIGWDAADWKVINPMLENGQMPALASIINNGVRGNLVTLDPPLSPMLWTSIATGKTADKHGILGFTEPDPEKNSVSAVLSTSRKVKAVWNILTQQGLKTNVIGWWPSHPAEPINGISISNFYQRAREPIDKPWKMMPGTVYPETLTKTFANLRIHPDELTEAHILPFVPNAAKVDQEKDPRIGALSKIIADCASIHAASTWVIENESWDFMGIYYDAIDHFGHGFMKFHPPHLPGIPENLFEMYKDVVVSGYRFHDMMLERLLQLAGPDTTVMVISDHGFHSDHLRPLSLPIEPAAPAFEHSPYGIVAMKGDHIRKNEMIEGATVLDITPTILTLLGLPTGDDMDGHSLVQVFDHEVKLDKISSWEDKPGECGMHSQTTPVTNSEENNEVLDHLVELGYIEKPDENKKKAVENTTKEAQYNLARVYIHKRSYLEAIPILKELCEKNPDQTRFSLRLASCYQNLNKMKECRKIVDNIRSKQKKKLPMLDLLEGTVLLGESKPGIALKYFKKAEKNIKNYPDLYLQIGRGYSQLNQWEDAERAFRKAIDIDPDSAVSHHGLSVSLLRRNRFEEAATEALEAVGLVYNFPFAHYHLGESLIGIKEYKSAAEAFEVCITQAPNIGKARQRLITIYNEHLNKPEKADEHKKILDNMVRKTIYVVSGLPRSGTSLMMQMLESGGMEIYTDGFRKADENNPRGFYEHENVKTLMRNNTWLKETDNKAVKIISHLLHNLPPNYNYKIIFMERDITEVISSQVEMLERQGKANTKNYPLKLELAFKKNLTKVKEWAKIQPNVEMICVKYTDIITDPVKQAEKVGEFLNNSLNIFKMAAVVDTSLYRIRQKK
ncbi:MAG: tetratricopeptide repeat protein [Cytophagales bacterium]|nr:tetratricopeptide repeat protein [Cytophagales bacterium]